MNYKKQLVLSFVALLSAVAHLSATYVGVKIPARSNVTSLEFLVTGDTYSKYRSYVKHGEEFGFHAVGPIEIEIVKGYMKNPKTNQLFELTPNQIILNHIGKDGGIIATINDGSVIRTPAAWVTGIEAFENKNALPEQEKKEEWRIIRN